MDVLFESELLKLSRRKTEGSFQSDLLPIEAASDIRLYASLTLLKELVQNRLLDLPVRAFRCH